jgi:hypothetical protein
MAIVVVLSGSSTGRPLPATSMSFASEDFSPRAVLV